MTLWPVAGLVWGLIFGQPAVFLYTFYIILPQKAERSLAGNVRGCPAFLYLPPVSGKVFPLFLEVLSCADDSLEVAETAACKQRLQCGEVVETPTYPHDTLQFRLGQVLVEHQQVVAEVEISLARISLWQCSAA